MYKYEWYTYILKIITCMYQSDSRMILSGSTDMTLRVWDARTGLCQQILEGHSAAVTCCDWSVADGGARWVLSGSDDSTLRVWCVLQCAVTPCVAVCCRVCRVLQCVAPMTLFCVLGVCCSVLHCLLQCVMNVWVHGVVCCSEDSTLVCCSNDSTLLCSVLQCERQVT